MIVVNIKATNSPPFSLSLPLSSTVLELKEQLRERLGIQVIDLRLVHVGRVLQDSDSLETCGLKNRDVIYVVKQASNTITENAKINTLEKQLAELEKPTMRPAMNSPFIKRLFSNPEVFKSLVMSNPQMKEMTAKNPEIARMMNDPAVIDEMVEAMLNPNYQQQMLRNQDRLMNNLQTIPEGFNALKKMYGKVQRPMMDAVDDAAKVKLRPADFPAKQHGINDEALPNPWAQTQKKPQLRSNEPGNQSFHDLPPHPSASTSFSANPHPLAFNRPVYSRSESFHSTENFDDIEQGLRNMNMSNNNLSSGGTSFAPHPVVSPSQPVTDQRATYTIQLSRMREMGFTDDDANIRALNFSNGDVDAAVELLILEMEE